MRLNSASADHGITELSLVTLRALLVDRGEAVEGLLTLTCHIPRDAGDRGGIHASAEGGPKRAQRGHPAANRLHKELAESFCIVRIAGQDGGRLQRGLPVPPDLHRGLFGYQQMATGERRDARKQGLSGLFQVVDEIRSEALLIQLPAQAGQT